jgi:hypothetical protein
MLIYVDIDETICGYADTDEKVPDAQRDYSKAEPWHDNIAKINALFESGNKIVYWTARGYVTGIDWYELTKSQLDKWGCKYHLIKVGCKPAYDMLICDRTKRIEEI